MFYLARRTQVNLIHLRERLIQSNFISKDDEITLEKLKKILTDRFDSIDFEQAKRDVEPFIRDTQSLTIWSTDFFKQITDNLTAINKVEQLEHSEAAPYKFT